MTGSSNSCLFSFICSVIRSVDIRVCECTLVICSAGMLYKLTGSLFVYACLQVTFGKHTYSKTGILGFSRLSVIFSLLGLGFEFSDMSDCQTERSFSENGPGIQVSNPPLMVPVFRFQTLPLLTVRRGKCREALCQAMTACFQTHVWSISPSCLALCNIPKTFA
jgi:hypothetical protein